MAKFKFGGQTVSKAKSFQWWNASKTVLFTGYQLCCGGRGENIFEKKGVDSNL